jgi:acetolactate synthase small subunit
MNRLAVLATLSDAPGALERALSLLRRRALPIESLSVSHTVQGSLELSVRFGALTTPVARVEAELLSVVDVMGVRRIATDGPSEARELALAQITGDVGPWPEADHGHLTPRGAGAVELTGSPNEIDRGLRLMSDRDVLAAAVRTGEIFLPEVPTGHRSRPPEGDESHGPARP